MATQGHDGLAKSLGSLASILDDKGDNTDVYLNIPLENIEEDPRQPRTEFDQAFLDWLAGDIKARGVQQPISVQPKDEQGKYRINAGAQRYRASRIAGQESIPAVIKADYDKYDQVNENDGREGLSTRDQSRFISRCLQEGDTKGYIADRLRINKSEITELLAFQKLPEEIISTLYETGIVTAQGPLYQLYLCYRLDKRKTLNYCNKIEKQGGTSIRALKALKKALQAPDTGTDTDSDETSETECSAGNDKNQANKVKHPVVMVRHQTHKANLLIHEPVDVGMVWIERSDGQRLCVKAGELVLEGIRPAS